MAEIVNVLFEIGLCGLPAMREQRENRSNPVNLIHPILRDDLLGMHPSMRDPLHLEIREGGYPRVRDVP